MHRGTHPNVGSRRSPNGTQCYAGVVAPAGRGRVAAQQVCNVPPRGGVKGTGSGSPVPVRPPPRPDQRSNAGQRRNAASGREGIVTRGEGGGGWWGGGGGRRMGAVRRSARRSRGTARRSAAMRHAGRRTHRYEYHLRHLRTTHTHRGNRGGASPGVVLPSPKFQSPPRRRMSTAGW